MFAMGPHLLPLTTEKTISMLRGVRPWRPLTWTMILSAGVRYYFDPRVGYFGDLCLVSKFGSLSTMNLQQNVYCLNSISVMMSSTFTVCRWSLQILKIMITKDDEIIVVTCGYQNFTTGTPAIIVNFPNNKKAVLSQRWPRDARYINR